MKEKNDVSDTSSSNSNGTCIDCKISSDSRIRHNHPFYYCIEHPEFQNIYLETIEHHLLYHTDHISP